RCEVERQPGAENQDGEQLARSLSLKGSLHAGRGAETPRSGRGNGRRGPRRRNRGDLGPDGRDVEVRVLALDGEVVEKDDAGAGFQIAPRAGCQALQVQMSGVTGAGHGLDGFERSDPGPGSRAVPAL